MKESKKNISKNREKSTLDIYFNELKRIPLLSREQEKEFAGRVKAGDEKAKEMLIRSNLRFVVKVAKKYRKSGIPFSDLISEGTLGLINAVDRYDVDKGYHFISYAVWWIQQAILRAISQKSSLIRLPENRVSEINRIKKLLETHEKASNQGEIEEVAQSVGRDVKTVEYLLAISQNQLSLDKNINHEDDEAKLSDIIEDTSGKDPETEFIENDLSKEIGKVLDTLPEREAQVIKFRYGLEGLEPLSLKEIGTRFNISKERVRQIQINALNKLKDPERIRRLRSYAG